MSAANSNQKKIWVITLVITFIIAFIFLLPQLSIVILAALMAFVFHPLYIRLRRKNGWIAAVTTLVCSLLIVVIPIGVVLFLSAIQLLQFADTFSGEGVLGNVSQVLTDANRSINDVIAPITGTSIDINQQDIASFLTTNMPAVARALASFLLGVVESVPQLAVSFIIYIFVFVELLVHGKRYVESLYSLSPFSRIVTSHFVERVGLMANAMVKGQLVISMIISAIAAALLIPLGYGQYVFILFILFTVLNFIPLGCGIVFIPLVAYSAFTGQFLPALVVFALYCVAANIDNVLRPIFIPKKIQLSTALTMVSTFCGIAYFGILGVVYGPIIMIIITTALSLYKEHMPVPAK